MVDEDYLRGDNFLDEPAYFWMLIKNMTGKWEGMNNMRLAKPGIHASQIDYFIRNCTYAR